MYVYLTRCIVNNKIYIGQHIGKFNKNYLGSGRDLIPDIKEFGKENFSVKVIRYIESKYLLNYWEKYYIKHYNSRDPKIGYNLSEGGDGGVGWNRGLKCPEISFRQKEKWKDPIYRKKQISNIIRTRSSLEYRSSQSELQKSLWTIKRRKAKSISMIGNKNGIGNTNGKANKGKKMFLREDGTKYYK